MGENDLFSMVQTYEDNDHYLFNAEINDNEHQNPESVSVSPRIDALDLPQNSMDDIKEMEHKNMKLSNEHRGHSHGHTRVLDAQEEYLHLTASAVEINYPTVVTNINELLKIARTVPFYQAYETLKEFMEKKQKEEEEHDVLTSPIAEHKASSPITEQKQPPRGAMAKLRNFGSSMVADILFSNKTEQPQKQKKAKRRVKRSQSVIISKSDQQKLLKKRAAKKKKLKSKELIEKNGVNNGKKEIVKLENSKNGVKIVKPKKKRVKIPKKKTV